MHADDFRFDRYGVLSGLRDGGYSDDMTLAAIAGNEFIIIFNFFILSTQRTHFYQHKLLRLLIIKC